MANLHASTSSSISTRELENGKKARTIATEGMVLLKNNGALPLIDTKKIALYGNGARKTVKGGTGSGDVYTRTVTTVEQGFLNAGFTITTSSLLDQYDKIHQDALASYMAKVKQQSELLHKPDFLVMFDNPFLDPDFPDISYTLQDSINCSTAVYVLSRNSGEGSDRNYREGDYLLTQREKENITYLSEHYEHTIILLNVGGIIDIKFLNETPGIDAILLMSQAGNVSGDALLDIITGAVTPSGKLADTWAYDYFDYPSSKTFSHNNGNTDDEYYTEGIYVGYRYFDTFDITPAYCFGYGESYTSFSIVTTDVSIKDNKVWITVLVTNTGKEYSGKEVVQVYYSQEGGLVERPYQALCAYAKTKLLKPQEQQELPISFDLERLTSFRTTDACQVFEAGTYYIRVGNSSRNTHISYALTVEHDVMIAQYKNLFALDEPMKELTRTGVTPYHYPQEEQEKADAIHIPLDLSHIQCETIAYTHNRTSLSPAIISDILTIDDLKNETATVEDFIRQLSVEDMADLCVGTSRFGVDQQSIIGGACITVPGAAGDTSSKLLETRNVRNMILADGPAGLRLNRHFRATKDGMVTEFDVTDDMPSSDPNITDYYQYCTAIPIATHLAQTWNVEMLRNAGDIVGTEMEEFGITLWLAPGMNIHRNPLCGRNFEYYSEDPLVSGLCAANETLGVQSHSGVGTTIKHFAGNNQEDNRLYVNDHISERALREIYLKGFEYCIKLAQPMAVMTSYNLINGLHTSNSHDLLTSVLRDEWRFQGIVMTDWGDTGNLLSQAQPTKYPSADMKLCIKAGTQLAMPGSQKDYEDILEGLHNGEISLGDLQYAAGKMIRLLAKTNCYENAPRYSEH